ncbi:glycine betaine ABC transporter substrate-binding protein [Paenibacillus durus]|uniref:Glycine/betaine ABC transporter substrate-binding protein n=1 Tax=Paenibacillus durus ATCC 35681 TaxID=1333534 RepID=A0A0F7CGW0_PAEDU|nr:glycine betaine ABC transporter substrate-binding protein [Paenibacillus durus]AKG33841.1 glycine/betaine ABC transporter substrate-binding protein [Paenibacillus durus ATCC 35681]
MKKSLKSIFTTSLLAIVVLSALLSLAGCSKGNASGPAITVGSKDFTESLVLAEIYAKALEDNGFSVKREFNISGQGPHEALLKGSIDLYPEYTGTALTVILKEPALFDAKQVYDKVAAEYKDKFKLDVLDQANINDSQGLVITKKASDQFGIKTISDLQKNADKIRYASNGSFDQREDGLLGLKKVYGEFNFKSSKVYDGGIKYQVLKNDEADLAVAYTTEGSLVDPQFVVLDDDKHLWPPYYVAPVVRESVIKDSPKVANVLNAVSAKLDNPTIIKLNAAVDIDKKEYEEVAGDYFETIKADVKAAADK